MGTTGGESNTVADPSNAGSSSPCLRVSPSPPLVRLRRFIVLQTLLLWQGGFLFYTAVVVPTGTKVLGPAGQGAITARVTDVLNIIGIVGVAVLAVELGLSRDPSRRRTAARWWLWGVALLCQALLLYLHVLMDAFMDPERTRVVIRPPFYPVHRIYLWASTVQWLACLVLTGLTVAAWRSEDRVIQHKPAAQARGG